MNIKLSGTFVIGEVVKQTKAEFFCDLVKGDELKISMTLINIANNRGSSNATHMVVSCDRLNLRKRITQNKLVNILETNFKQG